MRAKSESASKIEPSATGEESLLGLGSRWSTGAGPSLFSGDFGHFSHCICNPTGCHTAWPLRPLCVFPYCHGSTQTHSGLRGHAVWHPCSRVAPIDFGHPGIIRRIKKGSTQVHVRRARRSALCRGSGSRRAVGEGTKCPDRPSFSIAVGKLHRLHSYLQLSCQSDRTLRHTATCLGLRST